MTLPLPHVEIVIGGQRCWLCFTYGAIAEAEEILLRAGLRVKLLHGLPNLNLFATRILFAAALRVHHSEICFEDARRLVDVRNGFHVADAVVQAWLDCHPAARKSHPKRASKKRRTGGSDDDAWDALFGFAGVHLGLSNAELLGVTPRRFAAYVKQYEDKLRRADQMTEVMGAQMVAMTRRCGFIQFEQQLSASEFMPSTWAKREKQKRTRKYREKVLQDWRLWRDLAKARARAKS